MLRKKSTFQQRYKRNQEALVVFFLAGVSRSNFILSVSILSVSVSCVLFILLYHVPRVRTNWIGWQYKGVEKAAHHNNSYSVSI